ALATELTFTLSTILKNPLRLEMANLPTDMELELAELHGTLQGHLRLSLHQMQAGLRRRTDDDARPPPLMNPSTSEHSLSCKTSKKPWHWRRSLLNNLEKLSPVANGNSPNGSRTLASQKMLHTKINLPIIHHAFRRKLQSPNGSNNVKAFPKIRSRPNG
ncbi:hypothetical protein TNCV_5091221, partial [Trichonephila clavipes]